MTVVRSAVVFKYFSGNNFPHTVQSSRCYERSCICVMLRLGDYLYSQCPRNCLMSFLQTSRNHAQSSHNHAQSSHDRLANTHNHLSNVRDVNQIARRLTRCAIYTIYDKFSFPSTCMSNLIALIPAQLLRLFLHYT